MLTEHGVSLYWHQQGIETLLANGKRNLAAGLIFALLSEMARAERETLSERVRSGLQAARRNGGKAGETSGHPDTEVSDPGEAQGHCEASTGWPLSAGNRQAYRERGVHGSEGEDTTPTDKLADAAAQLLDLSLKQSQPHLYELSSLETDETKKSSALGTDHSLEQLLTSPRPGRQQAWSMPADRSRVKPNDHARTLPSGLQPALPLHQRVLMKMPTYSS